MSEKTAWRIVVVLSIVAAGSAVGDESAQYFWDLTSYVIALDTPNPYRSYQSYPFLYPPFTADVFIAARSHLFEFLSISYVAAVAYFLSRFARLELPRRFEWLMAMTAIGGLGVVSFKTGNLGILMNFTLLALLLEVGMEQPRAVSLLPLVIGVGALLKPQFILYLGLLPFVERSMKTAVIKMAATVAGVAAVYAGYMLLRPQQWGEYVAAVAKRTVEEKDFGWGPAAMMTHFSDSNIVAIGTVGVVFLIVAALGYAAWRKSVSMGQPVPILSVVCLAFFALSFANPRFPLYDLYAAAIALGVCCCVTGRPVLAWVLVGGLAINLVPWSLANFARTPDAFPWWARDLLITHMLAIGGLLVTLTQTGLHRTTSSVSPTSSSPAS